MGGQHDFLPDPLLFTQIRLPSGSVRISSTFPFTISIIASATSFHYLTGHRSGQVFNDIKHWFSSLFAIRFIDTGMVSRPFCKLYHILKIGYVNHRDRVWIYLHGAAITATFTPVPLTCILPAFVPPDTVFLYW